MLNYNVVKQGSKTSPLALLVHGRAGNISVMSIFKHSIPKDWNLLFIEAPYVDPEEGGFSWWIKGAEDRKEQIDKSAQSIKEIITQVKKVEDLNPNHIIALGFSQGGAILSRVVYSNPSLISKLALLSSFALSANIDNCNLSNLKVYIAHGTEDKVVSFDYNQQSILNLSKFGAKYTVVTDETGHKIGRNGMKGLKAFLIK